MSDDLIKRALDEFEALKKRVREDGTLIYEDTDSVIIEDPVKNPNAYYGKFGLKNDGLVEIQGDMQLFECEKRKDENNPCNCGSTPVGSSLRTTE